MRTSWIVVGVALIGAAASAGWTVWRARERAVDRGLLADARTEMEAGRMSTARTLLARLLDRRPDWDEAWYELGVCEQARGRGDQALKAWSQIPETSARYGWVATRRSKIEMDRGRFDESERLLRDAGARPGDHQAEARWGLVLLLRIEGRFDEAKRWLEAGFHVMTSQEETLRRLYQLDHDPYPAEGVRKLLERAGSQAPDDDRVWLAEAHLAVRMNRLDEAEKLLARCLDRRPDDPACWRIRLDWALAANRPDVVRECLGRVPADQADASRLRLWLAERSDDESALRSALEARLDADPVDAEALERLAQLEIKAGRAEAAQSLRARKTESDALDQDYRKQLFGPEPIVRASELAALARRLGREFDGAAWADLAAGAARPRAVEDRPPARFVADLIPASLATPPASAPSRADASSTAAAALAFVDDAEPAGLTFTQDNGDARRSLTPPVTSSGGVGLLDYDGDGWLDVFFVQGGRFPPEPACFATGGTARSRTSPSARGSPRSPAVTATASPSATTTTTADPTCSSPDGGATHSIATGATGRSRTRPRRPGSTATATGRPRPPGPTSTATATSTFTSATTFGGTKPILGIASTPTTPPSTTAARSTSSRCPTTSSATTADDSSTSPEKAGSTRPTAEDTAWSPPISTRTAGSTSSSPTT